MRSEPFGDPCDIVFDLIQRRECQPIVAAIETSESLRHLRQRRRHNADANRSIREKISALQQTRARSVEKSVRDLALTPAERIDYAQGVQMELHLPVTVDCRSNSYP